MNSQEKQGYIDEINYQKKMIHNLIKWLRNLFFLSSLGVLLMYYFSNILFVKIFCNHINNNIYISDYPCWKGYFTVVRKT